MATERLVWRIIPGVPMDVGVGQNEGHGWEDGTGLKTNDFLGRVSILTITLLLSSCSCGLWLS